MTPAEAAAALRELGTTPDEVAASLRRLGVTGRKGIGSCCPVANYLLFKGASYAEVEPSDETWTGRVQIEAGEEYLSEVDAPASVCDFANAFDEGMYPDLVGP